MVLPITAAQQAAAESILAGRSSAAVLAAMSPQQPDALLAAVLVAARRRGVRITLLFADLEGGFAFLDEGAAQDIAAGRLRLVSLAGAVPRRWSRLTDFLPYSLWDIDKMLGAGVIPVDIILARMSADQRDGQLGYGAMVGYTASALALPALAVFEVEAAAPAFCGTATVRRDRAAIVLPADAHHRAHPAVVLSSEQKDAGRHAAFLVPDGATLQLGLGAIAEAVIPGLAEKRDLGLHSGILTPALAPSIASGVISGAKKSCDVGLAVATGIYGAGDMAGFALQECIRLRPVSNTHDPALLSSHKQLWAVNSAIEIDLSGQVNAEYVDSVRVASGGGLSDFARAAHASAGGGSVIALPSRTRNGKSRVVAQLPAGCPASLQGQDVDYIVTEHGAANLRGLSARDRARALIAVAHPDDRAMLHRAGQFQDQDKEGLLF